MSSTDKDSHDRVRFAMLALAALATVGLLAGMATAGVIDAIGHLVGAIAEEMDLSKDWANAIEIGAEAIAEIVDIFWF